MSLGAEPLHTPEVIQIVRAKMSVFRADEVGVGLRVLDRDAYLAYASSDPDLRFALDSGIVSDLHELRDPVLADSLSREVVACPELAIAAIETEPAEIHRPFVEGAFLRKFFRFYVEGESWEAASAVRKIMRGHFAFQLIAVESILGEVA